MPEPSPVTNGAGQPSPVAPEKPQKHWVSAGEHRFNKINYEWIGYVVNALTSVVGIYWAERTQSGQNFIKGLVKYAQKIPGLSAQSAELLATKSFFLSGGFAVLLPMKWMEDDKLPLVKRWNRKIYGAKADTDPAIKQSERELAASPKQTWASIFSSRVLALIPFYITVGLLWDRKSPLSKLTNPELRGMGKDAIKAMETADPAAFSQLAAKGFYFDRPIAALSRMTGKAAAWAMGNNEAVVQISSIQARHPGMIKHDAASGAMRDPLHSTLPYYFISEAITSGMVAWGVYVLTRITAPFFDRKPHGDAVLNPSATRAGASASPPAMNDNRHIANDNHPATRIDVGTIHHTPATAQHGVTRS